MNRDDVADSTQDLSWEPISAALGNPPNFAALGNGSAMSVVSREWGRGAKAGALVELYYPHYDADNLWDSEFQEVPSVPASPRQVAALVGYTW